MPEPEKTQLPTETGGDLTSDLFPRQDGPETPTPEPETKPEPEAPSAPEPDKVETMIEDLASRVDEISSKLPEPAQPEPADPFAAAVPKDWQPTSWPEVVEKAREVARLEYETARQKELTAERQIIETETSRKAAAEKALDDQVNALERSGMLPKMTNAADPNDPGRIARAELYAIGVRYNSTDLNALATLKKDMTDKGFRYDIAQGRWQPAKSERTSQHPGANAPVSGRSTAGETRDKPTYKDIHNLTYDELLRRFGS